MKDGHASEKKRGSGEGPGGGKMKSTKRGLMEAVGVGESGAGKIFEIGALGAARVKNRSGGRKNEIFKKGSNGSGWGRGV